jgi:hypothetical protein
MAFGRETSRGRQKAPSLSSLSELEREFIDSQLRAARTVATSYLGNADSPPSLSELNLTVGEWYDDDPGQRVEINDLVNALGITFGRHLATDLNLEWVIATDQGGSDLALHGQPGDVLIYPANVVAKRIVNGESEFFETLAEEFVRDVRSIQDKQ